MRLARQFVIALLRGYKYAISPALPNACRYVPTCSEYAMEAVERFGVVYGSLLAAKRLLRCHPFMKGGYDPVPGTGVSSSTEDWTTGPAQPPAPAQLTQS
jgi:putative membrane protein insertion efficiency factor